MRERVGERKADLLTPALCLDLDAFERNVGRMSDFIIRRCGVKWRPHTKGQKIPALALREIAAGATGVTCAKLSEAEVMAEAGIHEILIANQVVGRRKAERLAKLERLANVIVAIDGPHHVRELGAAAAAEGVRIPVLVEVDVGMGRCGVAPGAPALSLARAAAQAPGLRFTGLMAWEAHTLRLAPAEKAAAVASAIGRLVETAEACRAAGLEVEIVSCGGTGTYRFTAPLPGITEIQAGGGVFGDATYASWGVDHEFALTVLATVTSRPNPARIVVDAGLKAMSTDHGPPVPLGLKGVRQVRLTAEHGILELEQPEPSPAVGDLLEFVPSWADTTLCLHDELCGIRAGRVEVVWPILGRGKLW